MPRSTSAHACASPSTSTPAILHPNIPTVFLCAYATMYDAFAMIDGALEDDGADSGRDGGDDLRMELDEWMAGYKRVTGYGFVGLSESKLRGDAAAKRVFAKMDDNGTRGA